MSKVGALTEIVRLPLSYSETNKAKFKSSAMAVLREIRERLNIEADIRWNAGGIAVSGDAILHGDNIYINLSESVLGWEFGFMYRGCANRKDYRGYTNHWMKWDELLDLETACHKFAECIAIAKRKENYA
jgi:hypothetical protein